MDKKITFREYGDADRDALAAVIRETWQYDRFCSRKTASAMSYVYLYACLCQQTFTQVALYEGVPVGIIMASKLSGKSRGRKFRFKAFKAVLRLLLTKEGRRTARFFGGISKTDDKLLTDCKTDYSGELTFFAVNPRFRSLGIGRELYSRALDYMKHEGISSFFLFTDTSCNYGFYEKHGMERRGEKRSSFKFEGVSFDMSFFIYEAHV